MCAWRIVDQQSVTLDQSLFNGSHGGRYIVPAGAYASLLAPSSGGNQSKAYTFSKLCGCLNFHTDGCFNHWENNMEVYERSSIRNIVLSSLEGINGTLFMYGQTGAGKTYTMLGNGMISGAKTRQAQFD